MAALVFLIIFLVGTWVVDLMIIQPLHLLAFLHVPQLLIVVAALVLFAWLIGDESSL
ncbi:MAG: hypothetical protein AAGB01_11600 [Cyanobacteria bacterium P01_F01_bin.42]